MCLRGAGFGVHLLEALGDAELARAADAVIAADAAADREAREAAGAGYAAEFPAAVRRLSAALHEVAGLPALRGTPPLARYHRGSGRHPRDPRSPRRLRQRRGPRAAPVTLELATLATQL